MHFPERLKRFIAHNYLKLFKKLFPYMDLKNDITANDGELACNVIFSLMDSNTELSRKTVRTM